jgi:predicted nuclease of predicted toxin-antitoxin system
MKLLLDMNLPPKLTDIPNLHSEQIADLVAVAVSQQPMK